MKKILPFLLVLFTILLLPKIALASTLNLSPGSGSVGVGGSLTVQVRLNSGEGVNGVSAYLSYPSDKLDVSYVSGSGTFAIEAENSFGGGVIKISRGSINPVSGNVSIATIGFKGKATGTATVGFIGGSAAPRASDSSDSLNLAGSSGGTYSIVAGAVSTVSPIQTTPANSSLLTPAIVISDIKVTNIATNSATIAWKTDRKAYSEVDYGLEKGIYFLTATDGNLVTDHNIKLEGPLLTPGTKLHFQVSSRNDLNSFTKGDDTLLQLIGINIKLKISDGSGQPLKQTQVLLYSGPQSAMTDQNGEVAFNNVTLGKHLAVIRTGAFEKTAEIEVKNNPAQTFSIQTSQLKNSNIQYPWKIAVAVLAILLIVTVVIVIIKKRHKTPIEMPLPN